MHFKPEIDGNTSTLELVFLESASASAYIPANTTAEGDTVYGVDLNGDGVADFYLRILDVSTGAAELNLQEAVMSGSWYLTGTLHMSGLAV